MSPYAVARKSFEDAKDLIKPPARDPVHWDMLNGLVNLTVALEADEQELKRRIERLEVMLMQVTSKR